MTVDDKDLVAIHSLTQLAVHGQTDKGDRGEIAAGVVRVLKERLAKLDDQKLASFVIGRRYAAHAQPRRTLPHGGPSRDSRTGVCAQASMCISAGVFFHTTGSAGVGHV